MAEKPSSSRQMKKKLPVIVSANAGNLLLPGNVRQSQIHSEAALSCISRSKETGNYLVLAFQEDSQKDGPKYGCVVKVVHCSALSDGARMAIFGGEYRCRLQGVATDESGITMASCEVLESTDWPEENEALALRRAVDLQVSKLLQNNISDLSTDAARNAEGITSLSAYIDFLALASVTKSTNGLIPKFLQEQSVAKRAEMLVSHLVRVVERHSIDRQIRRRVKRQMERTHHEFHLSEQAKAIQEELEQVGTGDSLEQLRERIEKSGMSEAAMEKCVSEHSKLVKCPPMSPESSVLRTYIETLLALPWQERSELNTDIRAAKQILADDHFGLEKVKERIMEYLAVQRRVGKPQGSVMCFVGPPGVGKTSLGKSIARATGREFVRVSLGGVHEEAAIRGHRKTYVASMPGRILKAMSKAKVRNPVFMLDEFDKLVSGSGMHGDPAAALLEVLDPEQNSKFTDQYVEVEFDLSEVMFITTANTTRYLPDALYDRLEIIRLPGYTDKEKVSIAKGHLIPKQLAEHGMQAKQVRFSDKMITEIVRDYTHEAGVRNLERSIAKICRKLVTEEAIESDQTETSPPVIVNSERVSELLEVPEYYSTFQMPSQSRIGYVNGMIYGYGAFRMEAMIHGVAKDEGVSVTGITKGDKEITSLISVATSLLQSRHKSMGLPRDFSKKKRVHIHLQDQATTPYGSLGLGIFALLASVFTKTAISPGVALLGEINLRGDVISSEYFTEYKATVMDAQRKKIKRIIVPHEDARLLKELPPELADSVEFVLVRNVWEALKHVLVKSHKKHVSGEAKGDIKDAVPAMRQRRTRPGVASQH